MTELDLIHLSAGALVLIELAVFVLALVELLRASADARQVRLERDPESVRLAAAAKVTRQSIRLGASGAFVAATSTAVLEPSLSSVAWTFVGLAWLSVVAGGSCAFSDALYRRRVIEAAIAEEATELHIVPEPESAREGGSGLP